MYGGDMAKKNKDACAHLAVQGERKRTLGARPPLGERKRGMRQAWLLAALAHRPLAASWAACSLGAAGGAQARCAASALAACAANFLIKKYQICQPFNN